VPYSVPIRCGAGAFAAEFAPEHLLLRLETPNVLPDIRTLVA